MTIMMHAFFSCNVIYYLWDLETSRGILPNNDFFEGPLTTAYHEKKQSRATTIVSRDVLSYVIFFYFGGKLV